MRSIVILIAALALSTCGTKTKTVEVPAPPGALPEGAYQRSPPTTASWPRTSIWWAKRGA